MLRRPALVFAAAISLVVLLIVVGVYLGRSRSPTPVVAALPTTQATPPTFLTSLPTFTISSAVTQPDTPTLPSALPTPVAPTAAATAAVSPTPFPPPPPARVAMATIVSLSQVTPVKVDMTTWKPYVNAEEGLSMSYPPDWTVVPSPGTPMAWVGFYPPTSNPHEPSPNITLSFGPNRAFPASRPVNVLVGSFRASEVEGQPMGGVRGSYDLLVAYRTGTIEFSVSRDLGLKPILKAMLRTLTLKP